MDEFTDPNHRALLERTLSLSTYEAFMSREVRDFFGAPTSRFVATNLFPGHCLTCADPLVSQLDISADFDPNVGVLVTAHHSACRPSSLNAIDRPMKLGTSACVLGYMGEDDEGLPLMAANPSIDALLLAPSGHKPYRSPGWRARRRTWTNLTVTEFASHGFVGGNRSMPPTVHDVRTELRGGRLTVKIAKHTWREHEWSVRIPEHVAPLLAQHEGFGLAILTKTMPPRLSQEELSSAFVDPESMIGWVKL